MGKDKFWVSEDALRCSYQYPNRYIESPKRRVIERTLDLVIMDMNNIKQVNWLLPYDAYSKKRKPGLGGIEQ